MFQGNTRVLLACVGGLMLSTSSLAMAADTRDVVRDASGDIVHNSFGNCVRTHWVVGNDACAQEAAPVSPARALKTEERTVYFDFDKYAITREAKAKLDSLANVLKSDKDVKGARIVGYADPIGTPGYNERLSQRRAKAVQNYLTSRGYLSTQIAQTRWLGETDQFAKCAETMPRAERIACLQPNRRVEVEIDFLSDEAAGAPATR